MIGNGGPHNGGDATGEIRVATGNDLFVVGGRGGAGPLHVEVLVLPGHDLKVVVDLGFDHQRD